MIKVEIDRKQVHWIKD